MMIRFGMINIHRNLYHPALDALADFLLSVCSLGIDAPIDSCDSSKSAPSNHHAFLKGIVAKGPPFFV